MYCCCQLLWGEASVPGLVYGAKLGRARKVLGRGRSHELRGPLPELDEPALCGHA